MSETKQIIDHMSVSDLRGLLVGNPGIIFIKFGATWCGPCKKVDGLIEAYFNSSPETVVCAMLDVDDNIELYGYLKKSRIVHGIPAVLCYVKGNIELWPDDSVTGADIPQLHQFFARCRDALTSI